MMYGPLRLPPALLDLTLVRASARLHALTSHRIAPTSVSTISHSRRNGHSSAALAEAPPRVDYSQYGAPNPQVMYADQSLYARRMGPVRAPEMVLDVGEVLGDRELSELEERVLALKETTTSEDALLGTLTYSDDELRTIYEDLLSASTASASDDNSAPAVDPRILAEEDAALVRDIASRLLEAPGLSASAPASPFSPAASASASTSTSTGTPSEPDWAPVLERLQEIARALDEMRISAGEVVMGAETGSGIGRREGAVGEMLRRVPTGILTNREWVALARTCIRAKDGRAAESVLDLMKRSGTFELEESVDEVLAHYATAGDVPSIERVLHAFAPSVPSERQRDLHVKAHIKATPRSAQPTAAMSLLHAYEARGLPAPQKSYTRTIAAFLAARTRPAHANALAWDLFAHMRYAAHPTPDASTYALMLRACAPPHRPADPARALDLLAEMTGDAGLAPTPAAYGAAALACARSGEKHHVHEAFRLAKEMLDAHRDARGRAQFRPDQRLFRALLEGAKRVGDLGRVRWILAEMVRESEGRGEAGGPGDVCVNEEVMVHVFNAYAAYRPTFRRGLTVLVDKQGGSAPPTEQTQETPVSAVGENVVQPHSNTSEPSQETPRIVADPDVQEDFEQAGLSAEAMGPQFSHIPPQSRSEAVAEAKILFNRIMTEHVHSQDADHSSPDQEQDAQLTSPRLFHHVRLTPRLLNAYLSVHYAHSPFDVWSDLHRTLFDEAGVSKNARSYVEVLERCTLCRRGQERRMALRLAEESWSEWQGIEEAWRAGSAGEGDVAKTVDARLVERANAAMIRMLSLTENSRRALEHVRAFTERYPPERVRVTPPKPSLLSTRTVLVGARPLVRLTSTVDIPDDCVPPLLTFSELEVLHIRLVALEDRAGIRYLKWVCKAYEGSLRRRRNASMRAVPEGSEPDQTQVHNQNSS